MRKLFFIILVAAFSNISCSSGGGGGSSAPEYTCTTVSYPNGITISGNADYEFRQNGSGIISLTNNPIRNAEVKVYNASNTLIQCGSTDSSGAFSVVIPQSNTTHTIAVNSIIYNTVTKAFVLNNPTNNLPHSITTTFTADTTKSVGTITATAASSGELKGGAFNILDKVLDANNFLVNETTGCTVQFANCPVFTGAPLVRVYWTKGFNPGEYFNAGALSFYLPGERELYILGGESGDIDSSDCDHFDNSIILHEYGHYIEDVFSNTDSPGGSHSGDSIIDARLAWGEGWGNFFQAAVLDNPLYRDTSGNITGSATVFFNENLETPGQDQPSTMGEGNFREFSITRLLWDAIDSVNEGAGVDDVTSNFSELWTAFAGTTGGLASSSYRFRNVGLFHSLQQALAGATDWSSIRTGEKHNGSQVDYGRTASLGGSCSGIAIQAANISGGQVENGSVSNSNHFASNDFYVYTHPGGAFNFTLNYTTDIAASADLDVYVYPDGYVFGGTASKSATTNIANGTTSASESITGTLSAGVYMINIRVDTGVRLGGASTYTMTLGGQSLCPN